MAELRKLHATSYTPGKEGYATDKSGERDEYGKASNAPNAAIKRPSNAIIPRRSLQPAAADTAAKP